MAIRILLADDELIVCKMLQKTIREHFPELEILPLAANGLDLLRMSETYHPEIVIADINMPGLDGLSAIEQLKAGNRQTHIILHTAYSEFTYAKKGIELGVEAYILKEDMNDELVPAVKRILEEIQQKSAGSSSPGQRGSFSDGSQSPEESRDRYRDDGSLWTAADHLLQKTRQQLTGKPFAGEDTSLFMKEDAAAGNDLSPGKYDALQQKESNSSPLAEGVSQGKTSSPNMATLADIFMKCCEAKSIKTDTEKKILALLYFIALKEEIFSGILHTSGKSDPAEINALSLEWEWKFLQKFAPLQTQEEICEHLKDSLNNLSRDISSGNPPENPNIRKAYRYIDENFQKDISLEDVAENAGISYFYMSRLLKQEKKANFSEILTNIRIWRAVTRMQIREKPVREICEETGFVNETYFYKVFKKVIGIPVGEFRNH